MHSCVPSRARAARPRRLRANLLRSAADGASPGRSSAQLSRSRSERTASLRPAASCKALGRLGRAQRARAFADLSESSLAGVVDPLAPLAEVRYSETVQTCDRGGASQHGRIRKW